MVVFQMVQDEVFRFLVTSDRKDNQYCHPLEFNLSTLMSLTTNTAAKLFFASYLYRLVPQVVLSIDSISIRAEKLRDFKSRLDAHKRDKFGTSRRYDALSLHSFNMRGTLEFRLKEGTMKMADLINWPLWCGWFVQKVSSLPDKQVNLWLAKNPPSLMDLTDSFTVSTPGGRKMPKSVAEWVRDKIFGPLEYTEPSLPPPCEECGYYPCRCNDEETGPND